jgi:hypothetical protein
MGGFLKYLLNEFLKVLIVFGFIVGLIFLAEINIIFFLEGRRVTFFNEINGLIFDENITVLFFNIYFFLIIVFGLLYIFNKNIIVYKIVFFLLLSLFSYITYSYYTQVIVDIFGYRLLIGEFSELQIEANVQMMIE